MRILFNPLFLISVFLFLANQMLERSGIFIPIINSYLDDLLCMPVMLTIALAAMRLIYKDAKKTLTIGQVVFAVIYFSLVFEIILPAYSQKYISDFFDILFYAFGGFAFYVFININPGKAILKKA